jgi:hypothetical protein
LLETFRFLETVRFLKTVRSLKITRFLKAIRFSETDTKIIRFLKTNTGTIQFLDIDLESIQGHQAANTEQSHAADNKQSPAPNTEPFQNVDDIVDDSSAVASGTRNKGLRGRGPTDMYR